jgi:haloalkane dehalogenase
VALNDFAPAVACSAPADLYPFRSQFFDRDGLKLHYLDEGTGTPVVMVHGNPTWSFYYRKLVAALRGSHRVIVPDHIGCGLSDKPDDRRYRYTLASRVDDLERLLESLGIDGDVTLVLHDWGGMIGMGYACRHPDSIARLVVLNTAAFRIPRGKRLPWQLRVFRFPWLGEFFVRGRGLFHRAATRYCCTRRPMSRAVKQALIAPYDSWQNRIAIHRFVQDIPLSPRDPSYALTAQVDDSLGQFRDRPMLICWGAQDFVFDDDFLQEWIRRFPDAQVHRFADAGHYVLEDAGDEIVALVKDFLSQTHPAAPAADPK